MTTESQPGLRTMAFNSLLLVALGCGIQALTAPTVTVSCPARRSAAPDCSLRWVVAFDTLPIRHTPLPALASADQVERLGGWGRSASFTRTAAGRVRVMLWGDHELRTFREPIVKHPADQHAAPLEVTMWPSKAPWRLFASVLVGLGLLQGAIVLTRLVRAFGHRH
jgi:hypothetical protein